MIQIDFEIKIEEGKKKFYNFFSGTGSDPQDVGGREVHVPQAVFSLDRHGRGGQ